MSTVDGLKCQYNDSSISRVRQLLTDYPKSCNFTSTTLSQSKASQRSSQVKGEKNLHPWMEKLTLKNLKQSLIHHSRESENASKLKNSYIQSAHPSIFLPFPESWAFWSSWFAQQSDDFNPVIGCSIWLFQLFCEQLLRGRNVSIIVKAYIKIPLCTAKGFATCFYHDFNTFR